MNRAIISDLIHLRTINTVRTDFSRLDTIQSFLRYIQDPVHMRKCRLTVDFTDRNDLSVVFTPRQSGYLSFCQQAAQVTTDYVNSHSKSSDPFDAIMASAVVVETSSHYRFTRVRRSAHPRVHRDIHPEHKLNSTGVSLHRIPPSYATIGIGVFFSMTSWLFSN